MLVHVGAHDTPGASCAPTPFCSCKWRSRKRLSTEKADIMRSEHTPSLCLFPSSLVGSRSRRLLPASLTRGNETRADTFQERKSVNFCVDISLIAMNLLHCRQK